MWTTMIIGDRLAYAAYRDANGHIEYAYEPVAGHKYLADALKAAVDAVLRKLRG